jgi:hypothetical protein
VFAAFLVVVGVPHPTWVESPRAVVVPTDPEDPGTLEELQAHIRPVLASYEKPTSRPIVETLPRNTLGKLLRSQIRDVHAGLGGKPTVTELQGPGDPRPSRRRIGDQDVHDSGAAVQRRPGRRPAVECQECELVSSR